MALTNSRDDESCTRTYVTPANHSITITTTKHRPVIEQRSNQKLLIIGIFAEVYLVDGTTIRKAPRSISEEDMQPIIRETTIYEILGDHPRIAECLTPGKTDYIDIMYYPNGDLAKFREEKKIPPELQSKWFQQMIEAIAFIHSHGVIHSDLALRQFFVDDDFNIRLGDFNASQYRDHPSLGYEKATHCMPRDFNQPNTIQSDLFALGSTLYELVTGKAPYSEVYPIEPKEALQSSDPKIIIARHERQRLAELEIETRYRNRVFPGMSHVFRGDVILSCWDGGASSAEDALHLYLRPH